MKTQLTLVHALSPLHAGIGQGAGVIDLPIAREKATSIPYLPGSSIKGALRTRLWQDEKLEQYRGIFGSDTSDIDNTYASSVLFSDQRLLLLPVRSIAGTFAWVTAPYVLNRFTRDLAETQVEPLAFAIPSLANVEDCLTIESSQLKPSGKNIVYLEDFDLEAQSKSKDVEHLTTWAEWLGKQLFPGEQEAFWRMALTRRLCLVHDDLFQFMCQHTTEIITRIKLQDESKTVDSGGLWYEEALPTESILTGIAFITPVKKSEFSEEKITKTLAALTTQTLQLGGKATVGRGMCRVRLV
jgi:CRISPR-associated protein Cmr4